MIKTECFVCNMLQENCYVVSDDTKECVIIDCGAFYDPERKAIIEYIKGNGLKPVHLLATHGHFDHNIGNNTVYDEFGLTPEVSCADESLIASIDKQAEALCQIRIDYKSPLPDHFLKRNEIIRFGEHEMMVIETPGHSPGSVTFYCAKEKIAFTGDTLFRHSIGRTDFAGGNMMQIIQSLRMLAQLPDETVILSGHGDKTTIGEELAHNPYMER